VAGDFLNAEAATGDIVPGRTADAGDLSWYGDPAYGTGACGTRSAGPGTGR